MWPLTGKWFRVGNQSGVLVGHTFADLEANVVPV